MFLAYSFFKGEPDFTKKEKKSGGGVQRHRHLGKTKEGYRTSEDAHGPTVGLSTLPVKDDG